jgi:preprotein translocase subunit SecA
MFQKIIQVLGGDPHKRTIDRYSVLVEQINALEAEFEKLSDDALRAKTDEFRQRLQQDETLDDLLVEAFAVVREASKRKLGLRHYDVQMVGGIALHQRKIAEMRTGEGKTLVATLPLYLNALLGKGAHLVTVNDYLARRDARWMAPIYQTLGMNVGVLQMASRTENGRSGFLIDLSKSSPHEDQHQLAIVPRREAYQADITYGTNSEFGFDYLRDNLTMSINDRSQRGHYYAIVDEVDNILIDEARTPLIISGPAQDEGEWYYRMAQVVRALQPEDYEVSEKDRNVSLTEVGEVHVEELLDMPLRDPDRPEDVTPEQARVMGYLEQALRAQFLFRRNKDYLVQAGKVVIVDEFTGRLMPGRRWSDGLHQAVEAKEGVKVEPENVTYATITIQNYFRMYEKLAGMSGTALTESEEFYKIYKLEVLPIPTNLEFVASRTSSAMVEVTAKDEDGYKFTYYARRNDSQKSPVFWKRKDYPDLVYRSEEAKLRAISQEIIRYHIRGQPQLVGTTSVEHSERLARRLSADPVRRLMQTLLIKDAYCEKNKIIPGETSIPGLKSLYVPLDDLEVGALRQLARDSGISMNPEDPANLERLMKILELEEADKPRLVRVLQAGVANQVLNARKHDEEAQIIARAGALGTVTIATNMAGRGVDIKLGGELDEEILGDTNRVLVRAGYDAYNMNNEERRQALLKLTSEDFGIYEEAVKAFLQYMHEMERVRELGGLHVVGSERHEARRIDNQLRGRAARQGDPGSSRFYLSLDDELMRLFGGQQMEGLLKRLNIDESYPIESGMVGRLVEQSQERVEGSNFDIRKHLLEYDDVLNSQRKRIYEQRDRVFTKDDLTEDVEEMLRVELQERIPTALKDPDGLWKLLAFIDQVQPPILEYDPFIYPSYTLKLVMNEVQRQLAGQRTSKKDLRTALLEIANRAWQEERSHLLENLQELLEKSGETLEQQKQERFEAIDAFLEGLEENPTDENGQPRRPQQMVEELAGLMHVSQLRLNPDQMRLLMDDPRRLGDDLKPTVESMLVQISANRAVGALERRVGEELGFKPSYFQGKVWKTAGREIEESFNALLDRQAERLLGNNAQIARDLDSALERMPGASQELSLEDRSLLSLLVTMAQGLKMSFDRRSHRQMVQRTMRLNYILYASKLLQDRPSREVTEDILEHLEGARKTLRLAGGRLEFSRLAQMGGVTLQHLDQRFQQRLVDQLGEERYNELSTMPLESLPEDARGELYESFGWPMQNETYRRTLLSAISDLWVDYLTRVEALRVSIGLESYAQRDPLVQYKSKASEMFRELLVDIRMGVISRMFLYRPQIVAPTAVERGGEPEQPDGGNAGGTGTTTPAVVSSDKKKKRRRH